MYLCPLCVICPCEIVLLDPPPLQIVFSTPFCLFLFSLFLYPLSAPVLNPLFLSLLPFLISPSLSTIRYFFTDQLSVLLR